MTTPHIDTESDEQTLLRILSPRARGCPYPLYEKARRAEPVWVEGRPVVVFGSYEACRSVLRDPRASNERRHALLYAAGGGAPGEADVAGGPEGAVAPVAEIPSFLFMDPPRHTELRRLVSHAFSPRAVLRLEPMIKELIDDLLDEAAAQGTLEAIDDFASPLPVTVICRVLGIDTGERNWYRTRSSLLGESVDPYPAFAGTQTPGLTERVRAERELTAFFTRLVADRRAAPREDLVSALVRAQDEGGLDEAEVVTTCRLLLNAGHETTVNLVGNGLLALTRAPDQLDLIRRDPGAADAAVEEILGLDPPLQLVHRHARTDMDVLGTHVPRGTTMVLLLAAANRDEAAVADAGRLDAGRATPRDHLSFGLGPHFCLGAPLGRLEARLAFTRFAQRVVAPRLTAGPLRYRRNVVLRGLDALPLDTDGIRDRSVPWETPRP
ncbi:cytochrome P450 [Streptomyces sp. NPDC006632]|uniref:cytochrome P450 n=1 Tax=Streptomyces sp. NPDC006632 TaxID=3157182 RepID=UPI0033AEE4CF